ncbi:MAG TPA: sigma-54 dependent transcriptional regulator [Myxococcaceae bacterium]|nr:sigma-54 dependent transcriptional regulator [Myxococcaceae bacterium]
MDAPRTPAALVVDDDTGVRQSLRLCLEADGFRVHSVGSAESALEALDRGRFDVVILDLWLGEKSGLDAIPDIRRRQPDAAILVVTAFASFESAVEAMRKGASDYIPKPFTPPQVRHAVGKLLEAQELRRRLAEVEARLGQTDGSPEFFDTLSPSYWSFIGKVARVAASDIPVLLRGESGTGKNVLASWIWRHSARVKGPFVSVNCPSLAGDLMNTALFGHRRGAFTGATADALGKVQEAEGGVLFLDEVGDLSLEAQARLLRFLNDRTYERVGEPTERKADVRVIAATNRSLESDVQAGKFREDLLFRLNVVSLVLPPLRERREDLPALAHHYLAIATARQQQPNLDFSASALAAIAAYNWPGNLRELRNAVERAAILSPGPSIEPEDLGLPQSEAGDAAARRPAEVALGADIRLEELEREHIARVIARAPTLEAAARILGIDSTTLQRKRKRYGLV